MSEELTLKQEGLISMIDDNKLGDVIKPLKSEIHLFDTYIAGTSYLADKTVIEEINIGDNLILQREENKFDSNAILVLTETQKKKVGYIPEKDNIVFARLLDAGKCLLARVAKMDCREDFARIKIGIYLVDF